MTRMARRAGTAALALALGAAGATLLASPASALAAPGATIGADSEVDCATNTVPVTLTNSGEDVDESVTFEIRIDFVAQATTYTVGPNAAPLVVDVPVARNDSTTIQVAADDLFVGRLVTSECDVPSGEDLAFSISDPDCNYQTGILQPFPAAVFSVDNDGNDDQAAYAFLVDGETFESGTLEADESRVRSIQLAINTDVELAIYTVDDEGDPLELVSRVVNPGPCYFPVVAPDASVVIASPEPTVVQGQTPTGDDGNPLVVGNDGAPINAWAFGFGPPQTATRAPQPLVTDYGTLAFDPDLGDVTFTIDPDAVVLACTPVLETVSYYVVGRTQDENLNVGADPENVAVGSITIALDTRLVEPNAADDSYSVVLGSTLWAVSTSQSLLLNDCDQTGASPALASNVRASLTTQAAHGTVVVNPDGTFSYRPTVLGYSGTDTFTYTITTTDEGQPRTSTATVTLQIQGYVAPVTPPAPTTPPALAATGPINTLPLTALGAGLLLVGAGSLVLARRRGESPTAG